MQVADDFARKGIHGVSEARNEAEPFFASRPLEVLPGMSECRSARGYTLTLATLAAAISEMRLNNRMT